MADNKPANTYAIKPQFRKKFMPVKVTGIIQDELKGKLENQEYNVDKAPKLAKEITDSIKKKLKDLGWERYKFVVQTVVGEQRGEEVEQTHTAAGIFFMRLLRTVSHARCVCVC